MDLNDGLNDGFNDGFNDEFNDEFNDKIIYYFLYNASTLGCVYSCQAVVDMCGSVYFQPQTV